MTLTLRVVFLVIAVVLFVLSALTVNIRGINLFHLAWAFVTAAFLTT